MTGDGWLLAIDTATSVAVTALGDGTGRLVAEEPWVAGYRHGEELLPRIRRLLGSSSVELTDLTAIVVGTGPGAFTGLRVGIATAKGLAHALDLPIVGVSTGDALIDAVADAAAEPAAGGAGGQPAAAEIALLLPAGPSDRVLVRHRQDAPLLPGGTEPDLGAGDLLVAVDLAGRAPDEANDRGERARAGLGGALVRIGAARIAAGEADDLARLVPEYVTLPRGVRASTGEVAWSRDHR
jgi:tRNA threonylcarbamoyl adenosine modification protein YeaZ